MLDSMSGCALSECFNDVFTKTNRAAIEKYFSFNLVCQRLQRLTNVCTTMVVASIFASAMPASVVPDTLCRVTDTRVKAAVSFKLVLISFNLVTSINQSAT
jgi:hypothetical protein